MKELSVVFKSYVTDVGNDLISYLYPHDSQTSTYCQRYVVCVVIVPRECITECLPVRDVRFTLVRRVITPLIVVQSSVTSA